MNRNPILSLTLLALTLVIGMGCGKKSSKPAAKLEAGVATGGGNAPNVRMETPTAKPSPRKTSMAEVAKHLDFGGNSFSYQSNEGTGSMVEDVLSLVEAMAKAEGDPQVSAVLKVIRDLYAESGLKDIQRASEQPGLYGQLQVIAVTMVDGSSRQTRFAELGQFNWTGQRRR